MLYMWLVWITSVNCLIWVVATPEECAHPWWLNFYEMTFSKVHSMPPCLEEY